MIDLIYITIIIILQYGFIGYLLYKLMQDADFENEDDGYKGFIILMAIFWPIMLLCYIFEPIEETD